MLIWYWTITDFWVEHHRQECLQGGAICDVVCVYGSISIRYLINRRELSETDVFGYSFRIFTGSPLPSDGSEHLVSRVGRQNLVVFTPSLRASLKFVDNPSFH